jgi:hypothetical protein
LEVCSLFISKGARRRMAREEEKERATGVAVLYLQVFRQPLPVRVKGEEGLFYLTPPHNKRVCPTHSSCCMVITSWLSVVFETNKNNRNYCSTVKRVTS